jgi:hypothetical protein
VFTWQVARKTLVESKMVAEVIEMMKAVEMHTEAEAQMYTRV